MPTIVTQAPDGSIVVRTRLPKGVSPPKCLRAKVLLTTATDSVEDLSRSVKKRPARMGMRIVVK
jgi:hypothetical protein